MNNNVIEDYNFNILSARFWDILYKKITSLNPFHFEIVAPLNIANTSHIKGRLDFTAKYQSYFQAYHRKLKATVNHLTGDIQHTREQNMTLRHRSDTTLTVQTVSLFLEI